MKSLAHLLKIAKKNSMSAVVIAIAGGTASGKTTVAKKVYEYIDSTGHDVLFTKVNVNGKLY